MLEDLELTPRDNGRAFDLAFAYEGNRYVAHIPRELLDDEVGDEATEDDRRSYVNENWDILTDSCVVKIKGGVLRGPFGTRIQVRPE